MSISRHNLSVIIVSFNSDHVIDRCIESIDNTIEIIVVDNSNNIEFKNKIEKKYKNVRCFLSNKNIGMGAGNNLGIKNVNKDFALILNPDVILEDNSINEIIEASKNIGTFGIIAPLSNKNEFPNYKLDKKNNFNSEKAFQVKSVDGYAMLLNLKRLKQIEDFNFFDENFFLFLENDDLCKRIKNLGENIFIIPKAKINHLGGEAVDPRYQTEIELSRNWHWMWSKFYFNKKHYGYINSLIQVSGNLFSSFFKIILLTLLFKKKRRRIYFQRFSGLINSMLGKKSWYRPKIFIN